MQETERKSPKNILMIAGVALVFITVSGVAIYSLVNPGKSGTPASSTSSPEPWPRVATKEQISEGLQDLDSSLKQAAKDQAAAKAALKESDNQIKVGN